MEKIIYSNRLNKTEYLRSLSLLDIPSFSLRIVNLHELLQEANVKYGIVLEKPSISGLEEQLLMYRALSQSGAPLSFEDAMNILNDVKELRKTSTTIDELEEIDEKLFDRFKDNVSFQILVNSLNLFLEEIKAIPAIDDISLMKLLLDKDSLYEEISYIKEDNISPLEKYFLEGIAKEVKEISLLDLYPLEEEIPLKDIRPYYGNISELEGVISNILENNYSFSDCLIITPSSNEYSSLLLDNYFKRNIPFTSEFGLPISSTRIFSFYKLLKELKEVYHFDVNGYRLLFRSGYFDTSKISDNEDEINLLAEIVGRLKVSYEKDDNLKTHVNFKKLSEEKRVFLKDFIVQLSKLVSPERMILLTNNLIDIFSHGIEYILDNYFINEISTGDNKKDKFLSELELDAKDNLIAYIRNSSLIKHPIARKNFLDLIEKQFIYRKTFNDYSLHITTLDKAISTVRKHIYFVSFNADVFPGKVKENLLFNDEMYHLVTSVESLSKKRIEDKNELFRKVLHIYKSLGSDIYLSFNAKNIVEVSGNNPSSVVLEEEAKLNRGDTIRKLIGESRYFDNKYSSLNKYVDEYLLNNSSLEGNRHIEDIYSTKNLLFRDYSPSKISTFFECKLKFLLDIKYVQEEEDYDIKDNIGYNTLGNLLHMAMEHFLTKPDMSEEEFKKYINDIYETYNLFDKPLVGESNKKEDFFRASLNAYHYIKRFDLKNSKAEYKVNYQDRVPLNDIFFKGSIDLLAKTPEGEYVVLDYKSGKTVKHKNEDTVSVLQAIVYALILNKREGLNITKAIYYYPNIDQEIVVDIPSHKEEFERLMEEFKTTLISKRFLHNKDHKGKACKYCPYKNKFCFIDEESKDV